MATKPRIILHSSWLADKAAVFSDDYDLLMLDGAIAGAVPVADRDIRVLVTTGSNRVTGEDMDALPQLGAIICIGDGYNGIHMDAAQARGICVTNGHGSNHEDVADHAVGLMIDLLRGITRDHGYLMADGWAVQGRTPPRHSLKHYRVGIVGLGSIGQAVADRLAPFGMALAWHGPSPKQTPLPRAASLEALAQDSDVLIVACKGSEQTRGLIDAGILAALGPGGHVVNVSRGFVIDEDALIAALKSGALAGAALDVFADEPTPAKRWADVPNVVLNPHIGGATLESGATQMQIARANLERFFGGEPMANVVH